MSQAVNELLAVFDAMSLAEQRRAIEALHERHFEAVKVAREIEVIGAYEQEFNDETDNKRPLAPEEATRVAAMENREVILAYLRSVPDDELLRNYRVVQFRLLEDESLWQVAACATIRREVGGWEEITSADVVPIPKAS